MPGNPESCTLKPCELPVYHSFHLWKNIQNLIFKAEYPAGFMEIRNFNHFGDIKNSGFSGRIHIQVILCKILLLNDLGCDKFMRHE